MNILKNLKMVTVVLCFLSVLVIGSTETEGETENKISIPTAGAIKTVSDAHDIEDTKTKVKKKNKYKEVKLANPVKKFVKVNSKYNSLNIRKKPNKKSKVLDKASLNDKVTVLAKVKNSDFVKVKIGKIVGYASKNYLSNKKVKIPKVKTTSTTSSTSYSTGNVRLCSSSTLNPRNGVVMGPSGRETYYNLPMSGVIRIMQRYGYDYSDYAVRSDGVKTLGGYVMVAADLSIRPRGSLVETSLGTGLVCDTGTFIYTYPTGLDIATAW